MLGLAEESLGRERVKWECLKQARRVATTGGEVRM